jgi:O-acetylhomoserine (thiol)-lyase
MTTIFHHHYCIYNNLHDHHHHHCIYNNLHDHHHHYIGIEVRFADPLDPSNFEKLIDEKTRLIYGETLPNPYLRVFPIQEVADIGKRYGIPLIIDNTASPILCKPIKHGASIVIHSLTKFIGGHGNSIGGIIIDSGNFDWKFNNGLQQPNLNEPDLSYGGVIWSDAIPVLTGANIPFIIRARVVLLRDLGTFIILI